MAKQFQRRRFFRNQPIRNKNELHVFLANLAKGNMSFCHHLVSVVCHPFTFHILIFPSENPQPNELKLGRKHLWKVLLWLSSFKGEDFLEINQSETRMNCMWWPCLLTDRYEISNLHRGHSIGIDNSYQVSVPL
jgi:hypothetical protein